ncbi:MAG: peptidylprolyl isomerase [Snowella sp.]|jgi:peptidyl-prolyl cis-trans isomerase B (cyclophilin B)|nr:MAG: peptidylprolyl isomerase [Snowella sp.]
MLNMTQSWWQALASGFLLASILLTGCSNSDAVPPQSSASPATTAQAQTAQAQNVTMTNYKPRLEGKATVEMIVNGSPITIEVDGENAPITAGNFVDLVERGVYNGLTFHRVVKDPQPFVVQGGDPKGNGTGGFIDPTTKKTRDVPLEIRVKDKNDPDQAGELVYGQGLGQQSGIPNPAVVLPHKRGALAMARSQMPNSASSQFYFALSNDLGFLDGDYAVFGYVTSGMNVVDKIKQGDKIQSAKVVSGADNLKK